MLVIFLDHNLPDAGLVFSLDPEPTDSVIIDS